VFGLPCPKARPIPVSGAAQRLYGFQWQFDPSQLPNYSLQFGRLPEKQTPEITMLPSLVQAAELFLEYITPTSSMFPHVMLDIDTGHVRGRFRVNVTIRIGQQLNQVWIAGAHCRRAHLRPAGITPHNRPIRSVPRH
jgi:hypothetical protein